jgi:hypothetical protein
VSSTRLSAKLQEVYRAGKFEEILSHVEACLPKDAAGNFIPEQEKSDVVHDLMALLAERMLEMNKDKQKEIKGFLGWLESYLGAKEEDLIPGHPQDEQTKAGHRSSPAGAAGRLRLEFDASLASSR